MNLIDMRPVGDVEIVFEWEDGHRALYGNRYLRFLCPCAGCVDEMTGKRTIKDSEIQNNIQISEIQAVGRYGLKLKWNDGHQTGIYSFDYLRRICPCEACAKSRELK